jgi:enoyl-CoA hydratase/carnithine racemase
MAKKPEGYENILVAREGAAVEITLHRPERLNAMNEAMAREILDAMMAAERERDVLAIVLAGDERAFCSGADLGGFKESAETKFDTYRERFNLRPNRTLYKYVQACTKPVISAVEGYCLGGGLELAMMGDIIVAGAGAQFGLPEARHGLIPGAGGTQNLPRLIGKALAKELMWTARRITAKEALEMRLVNHCVPKGEALDKAREIVAAMAKNGPLAIMMIKQAVNRGMDVPLMHGWHEEQDLAYLLAFSEDRDEGVTAFAEKRPPRFKGQ